MSAVAPIAFILLVFLSLRFWFYRQRVGALRTQHHLWKQAAQRNQWSTSRTMDPDRGRLFIVEGKSANTKLRVEISGRTLEDLQTRLQLSPAKEWIGDLSLELELTPPSSSKKEQDEELPFGLILSRSSGNPGGRELLFKGEPALIAALIDSEARTLFEELSSRWGVEVKEGVLSARVAYPLESLEMLDEVLDPLRRALQRLHLKPEMLPQKLQINVLNDPLPEVRLRSLKALLITFPKHPLTAKALQTALSDGIPQVRLNAARHLGAEGNDALLELLDQPWAPPGVRAEALTLLAETASLKALAPVLERFVVSSLPALAIAAIEAAAKYKHTPTLALIQARREKKPLHASVAKVLEQYQRDAHDRPGILHPSAPATG